MTTIPSEAERRAAAHASMAATVAAHGTSDPKNWAPGAGARGNPDNYKQAEHKGVEAAQAAALTPQQVVEISASARHKVIKAAIDKGKPIDYNAAARAGEVAVQLARSVKTQFGRASS
jgi:hypothetical protein